MIRALLSFPSKFRDLGRLRRIATVLVRHGLGDVAERMGLTTGLRRIGRLFRRRGGAAAESFPVERRIRITLEALGPTFIKLGQMLAMRPDLVPMALVLELRRLHDRVPPFPVAEVRATIESELGRPLADVFATFDDEPIAAASIAQVHRATLASGEAVVVKVQRPSLPDVIASDLRLLSWFATVLEDRVPESRQFRPRAIVDEFQRSLRMETDFSAELASMVRFRRNFLDEPDLHIPVPREDLSTRRVLVMEQVDGIKVTDRDELIAAGIDLRRIIDNGMRLTLRSIFEFGFFHADPHPGNFFVQRDGRIALLDFGMMGSIEPRRVDEMLAFMVSLLTADLDRMIDLLLEADLIGDETDMRAMRSDLGCLLQRYQDASLQSVDVSQFVAEVSSVAIRHHVMLPSDLLLVGKAMATMEGIALELVPDFRPLEAIRPYLTEVYLRRMLDAKRHSQVAVRSLTDGLALLKDAPADVRRILRKLRRGELTVVLRHADADERIRATGVRSARFVLGMLFPVFFFGGTYLVEAESGLQNLAGLLSFCLAGVFFIGLSVSLLRGTGGSTK